MYFLIFFVRKKSTCQSRFFRQSVTIMSFGGQDNRTTSQLINLKAILILYPCILHVTEMSINNFKNCYKSLQDSLVFLIFSITICIIYPFIFKYFCIFIHLLIIFIFFVFLDFSIKNTYFNYCFAF